MPREVRRLADEMLYKPHVVELATSAPAATIDHGLVLVSEQRKRDLLQHLLGRADCRSAIVFTRTKHRAKRLASQLNKAGHRAVDLRGNLSQAQRDRAMRGFRSQRYDILVATDIAARGIDVSGVSHVINFDVPSTPEQYAHRIGRTGRAELEGIACTFVTSQDHGWLRATERMLADSTRSSGELLWLWILSSVVQCIPVSRNIWRLLTPSIRTRRRISVHCSMSVYASVHPVARDQVRLG